MHQDDIRFDNVSWSAGSFRLNRVSFVAPSGLYSALMGRTGCGKTTIVELITGLRRPQEGTIWIGTNRISDLPPEKREVGYVPQDAALFPTMTVRRQLGFALRIRKKPRQEVDEIVDALAIDLGIDHLLDRKPDGLSGGERQRVALGRALALKPRALLLDEPMSALDEDTRDTMADLLKRTQRQFAITALHVTHHRAEAKRLADRAFRMVDGRIEPIRTDDL